MDLRPGQNKRDLEGTKQLPAECNRKPLEKRIQYTQKQVYGHKENFLLTTPAEGQEGSAGYKPPMHFANTDVLLCRNTLPQCCSSRGLTCFAQLLLPVQNQQDDEHPPQTGRGLALPGLGWASSGHTKLQGVNKLVCRTSKWFSFCFKRALSSSCPLPVRHLIAELG